MTQLTQELLSTTLFAFLTSFIMAIAWIFAVIREVKTKNYWWAIVCTTMVIFGLGFSFVYSQVLAQNIDSKLAGELYLRPMVIWLFLLLVAISLRFRKN